MINIGDPIPDLKMPTLQCPSCDEMSVEYVWEDTWECQNPWCACSWWSSSEDLEGHRDTWKVPQPRKPVSPYRYPEEVEADRLAEQALKDELARERLSGILFSFEEPPEDAIIVMGGEIAVHRTVGQRLRQALRGAHGGT